jgi:dihydrodipicolinate synthase/N-acetylneuraminate lyase
MAHVVDMLTATGFHGLYAIIPTPATANADRWDATATVDLTETARLIDTLIGDGVDGLIALGTTGECATLTTSEYETFVECVLATVRGRIPTLIGTTALGTHEVVRRTRFAQDRGADGILLGLPMWQPCTPDMAIPYYASISAAFPKLGIMVYANARAFRFNFSDPAFWEQLVPAAPTVVAAKFSRANALLPLLAAAKGRVHFLPHDDAVHAFMELSPETTTACWATSASMGPEPPRALIDAILAHDLERAAAVAADIAWANEPTKALLADADLFASYNIQLEKTRINSAGYCNAGPVRPPYDVFPDVYRAGAVECGVRWRQLRKKYASLKSR